MRVVKKAGAVLHNGARKTRYPTHPLTTFTSDRGSKSVSIFTKQTHVSSNLASHPQCGKQDELRLCAGGSIPSCSCSHCIWHPPSTLSRSLQTWYKSTVELNICMTSTNQINPKSGHVLYYCPGVFSKLEPQQTHFKHKNLLKKNLPVNILLVKHGSSSHPLPAVLSDAPPAPHVGHIIHKPGNPWAGIFLLVPETEVRKAGIYRRWLCRMISTANKQSQWRAACWTAVHISSLRRGGRRGGRREVREGVWRPGGARKRWIEKRGGRRGVEREIGWGEMVRRWWRVRAGRGEVHGRWRVCVSGGSVRLSERWVFIPRVLMPERGFGLSWWETPAVRLLWLLGNVVRIIWGGGLGGAKHSQKKVRKCAVLCWNVSGVWLMCVWVPAVLPSFFFLEFFIFLLASCSFSSSL